MITGVDPIIITAVMFGGMILLMALGIQLIFALGIVAVVTVGLLWGTGGFDMLYYSTFGVSYSYALTCLPLFIFMGVVLQKSGIGEELFEMAYRLIGGTSGGLAIGVVVVCAVIAAMVGLSAPATITMGIIALPAMLKRGYDKRIATGTIQAGGVLGILIPPSITMIMYAFLAGQSTGRMFAAGLLPGLVLVTLFIMYIYIRCRLQPHMGPPIPVEERYSWLEKFKSLKALILPGLLIFIVLGLIILGVTSPTEASGVGAAGALLIAAIYRTLNWKVLKESVFTSGRLMGFIMWIMVTAVTFSKIYHGLGAHQMLEGFIATAGLSPYGVLALIMFSYLILGMFLETGAVTFLTVPLYVPLIIKLGFDPIWFGILYIITQETAFLTPPYGFNLFCMRAIVPPEITYVDIMMSIIPFVGLQILGLVIVIIFPQIALILPNLLFGVSG